MSALCLLFSGSVACTPNGGELLAPPGSHAPPDAGGSSSDAASNGDVLRPDSASASMNSGDASTGSDASPGSQGDDASASADSGGSVLCGNDTCDPLYARGVIALPACCVPDTNACGSDVRPASSYLGRAIGPAHSCQPKNQPGVPDPACPTSDVSVVALAPCCKPNGHCGLFTNDVLGVDLGLGCVDPTELGLSAGPDGGVAQTCTYPAGGAPTFDLDASSIH